NCFLNARIKLVYIFDVFRVTPNLWPWRADPLKLVNELLVQRSHKAFSIGRIRWRSVVDARIRKKNLRVRHRSPPVAERLCNAVFATCELSRSWGTRQAG